MSDSIQTLRLRLASLALFAVVFAVGMVACDSGPAPTHTDLTGTITGQVIDNATSAPIEGANVTVAADSLDAEDATLSATTNSNGKFTLSEVPVTRGSGESATTSATYGLRLEPNDDSYRDVYRGQVEVRFGDGGTSAVEGLVANVTFPLSKTNGTVTGKAVYGGQPLTNAELGFVQELPVQFDGDGNPTQTAEIRTTTTTTDSEGNFTFENAEVDADFNLEVRIEDGSPSFASGSVPSGEDATLELGELDVSGFVAPLKITNVSPAPESDVNTTEPSITFSFNRPVIENQFTTENLVDELNLSPNQAKDLRTDDNLPIELTFDSTRTELTVSPTEPLEDGFIYQHSAPGFSDAHFTDAYGIPLGNPADGYFEFSVGLDENSPAVPSVAFQNNPPTLDYISQTTVTAELELDVDNSEAEVKGYEVYARTYDMRAERTGESGQFKKIFDVTPEASSTEFEEWNGIIPASEADFDGTLEFSVDIGDGFDGDFGDETPLAADDGSYGPIEWKVRTVSINNVRSDFSDVVVVGDSIQPRVHNTVEDDTGSDELTLFFSEALDKGSAGNEGNYTVVKNGTDISNDIQEAQVENVKADNQGNWNRGGLTSQINNVTEVTLVLNNDIGNADNIEVNVSSNVEDLAGNSMDANANDATN